MLRQEIDLYQAKVRNAGTWYVVALVALVIFPPVVITMFFRSIHSPILNYLPIALFVGVMTLLILKFTSPIRIARKAGLVCSACRRTFSRRALRLVVASDHCPFCGTRAVN
jgi:hypothetical protein